MALPLHYRYITVTVRPEMAFADLQDDMDNAEQFVKFAVAQADTSEAVRRPGLPGLASPPDRPLPLNPTRRRVRKVPEAAWAGTFCSSVVDS